jgi:protein-disulfide isomerase
MIEPTTRLKVIRLSAAELHTFARYELSRGFALSCADHSRERILNNLFTPRLARILLIGLMAALGACSRQEESPPAAQAPAPAVTPPAPAAEVNPELSPELAARLSRAHSPVIGPAQAPVTITEFLDPACEGCAAFAPVVKQIQLLYPEEVRVVVRYAAFHPGSDEAVRLLDAARHQGRFEPVLDALFQRQQEWASHHAPNIEQAWTIAGQSGLNITRARRDARKPQADEVLRQDGEDVVALKVERTPTFFVNGRSLSEFGPQPLIELVKQEIEKTRPANPPDGG